MRKSVNDQVRGAVSDIQETLAHHPHTQAVAKKFADALREESTRVPVTTRISAAGVRAIEELAAAEDRPRSAMIRILLEEAVARRRKVGR